MEEDFRKPCKFQECFVDQKELFQQSKIPRKMLIYKEEE